MTKIWLIVAASLIALGLIIFAVVMTAYGWDFTKLSTVQYVTNTYEVGESFRHISIETITADIVLAPSPDGMCKVVCNEEEKLLHSVSVKDDTLTVNVKDDKAWYEYIGIHFGQPKITVYLPGDVYGNLSVKATTGDVDISKDFQFGSVDVSVTTGDIQAENLAAASLDLAVTTGDVSLRNVTCEAGVKIEVSTGDTNLTDIRCKSLVSEGTTGDIKLKDVIAMESFSIHRTTGDVGLDGCDAADIYVKTDTGDIKGTLLSGKVFIAETDTGKIRVPKGQTGGRCELITDTGNIIFNG